MAALLDDDQVREALAGLDGWSGTPAKITRVIELPEANAVRLIDELGRVSRELDHDPDLERDGDELSISLSTHSAGGVTDLDVTYARRVDELLRDRAT